MSVSWRPLDRRRLLVTALCLVAWRALDQVPIMGISQSFWSAMLQFPDAGGLLHMIGSNAVPFAGYSLGSIGIAPYIYSLMLVSLVPAFSARVAAMQRTYGRISLGRWTRALGVLLSLVQAYAFTGLMQMTGVLAGPPGLFPRLAICLELAGGTVVTLLLADLIDQFGLGFGYAPFQLFALRPIAGQVHRLADYAAFSPWGLTTFFKATALWAVISVAIVVATVAYVRAARGVIAPTPNKTVENGETALTLLQSGVLRPPLFAAPIMVLPIIFASSLVPSHPEVVRWITEFWNPYSAHAWTRALYVAVESCLIIGLAVVVARMDHARSEIPDYVRRHIVRLAFIGGCFLALTILLVPVLEQSITSAAGDTIPLSGFDVVIVVAVIMATLAAAQSRPGAPRVVTSNLP